LNKGDVIKCPKCFKKLTSVKALKYHLKCNECVIQKGEGYDLSNIDTSIFKLKNSAFKKFLVEYTFKPNDNYNDAIAFFFG
jgi:hypothetical protein